MAAVASLCCYPLSAASLPRTRASSFTRTASWSSFAATSSSGHCCGCEVPCGPGYARLRSRWRSPVCAKIDEVDKDKGTTLEFRPPSPDRRKPRLRLRVLLRLLQWRLRRRTELYLRRRRARRRLLQWQLQRLDRRKRGLRLRPRLRLLMWQLQRLEQEFEADAKARDEMLHASRRSLRRALRGMRRPEFGVLVLLAILLAAARFALSKNAAREVAYSNLVAGLRKGAVSAVAFEEDSRRIYFRKKVCDKDGSDASDARNGAGAATKWPYYARRVPQDEGFLLGLMHEGGVDYKSLPRPASRLLVDMLVTLLTLWVSLLPIMWFIHTQMLSGGRAEKRRRPGKKKVLFDDVQGVDEAKEELVEIVSCLHGSLNYKKLGAKLPRGVLLVGPPGTGKTLLARAVAGEAGIPFFSVSASEFVELYVGRGAARVRDLFKEAKEAAPSIIFIDELDAVGGTRGGSFNDERDQTLNQLLTEMDGFDSDMKVVVMAATNRPKTLDAALCRPGRFSRKVVVGVPDLEGRKKILAVHLREIPLEEDPEIISNLVACLTPGMVGADLANIVNEAALLAARRGANTVAREDIMVAIEREKYGVNGRQQNEDSKMQGLTKLFPWLPKPGSKQSSPDDFGGLMGYHTSS